MDPIEIIAVIFGFICVWLTIRQNIWCWPTGLVQVLLFIQVFLAARLYSDMLLHVIYVPMQIYGWYHWLHGGARGNSLPVTLLSARQRAVWLGLAIGGTALLGFGMASQTDAALPYPDAFTSVASLIAQWLMARKKLESWVFWIAVDVVAIGVYWNRELYPTAGLYASFLVLASGGLLAWRRSLTPPTTQAA